MKISNFPFEAHRKNKCDFRVCEKYNRNLTTIVNTFSARQDNDQQRPRPFVATQPQEFRGYLPPQPPAQPEFTLPTTTSQFPATQPGPVTGNQQFFQTAEPDQSPDQTPPPPQPQQQPENSPQSTVTSSPDVQSTFDFSRPTTQGFAVEPSGFLGTNPPFDANSENLQSNLATDDDTAHPPHIHQMNVQCSKDMMTINVEFNKPYDGVIYSKVSPANIFTQMLFLGLPLHTCQYTKKQSL